MGKVYFYGFGSGEARLIKMGHTTTPLGKPQFWGHPEQRTGTNHPHAIVYFGNRVSEFRSAFKDYGIPFMLD